MTRRGVFGLLITGGGLFVAGGLGLFATLFGASPVLLTRRREAWRTVGPLGDFPVGVVVEAVIPRDDSVWPRSFRQTEIYVWRRSESAQVVFSRSCTDLGCPLTYEPGSACFFCPCHGGIFAQDGQRLAGPPNGPMFRYAHRIRAGVLEVDAFSVPPGV